MRCYIMICRLGLHITIRIGLTRLKYSIYAGRNVVPGLEGLLLECTADVNRVWSPLSVPRWSSTAWLITKYLVNRIKICFCSNNDGDYENRVPVSTNVLSLRTRPLLSHQKAYVSGQIEQGHFSITLLLSLKGGFELYGSI